MTLATLADLGVQYWSLDPSKAESGDPELQKIRDDNGYSYQVRPNGTYVGVA